MGVETLTGYDDSYSVSVARHVLFPAWEQRACQAAGPPKLREERRWTRALDDAAKADAVLEEELQGVGGREAHHDVEYVLDVEHS